MADCQTMDTDTMTSKVDVSQLCRLCALQSEHPVPIFEGPGLELEFETKLQKHLFLKVSKDDVLPRHICEKCSNTLVSWDKFFVACKEAEERLLSMLREEENRSDGDSDIVLLDENSQDCIKVIENDAADSRLVSQPSIYSATPCTPLPGTNSVKTTFQGHQSSLINYGTTMTLLPGVSKSQGPGMGQFPGHLVLAQSQPTTIGRNVLLLKSQDATKTQPNLGLLAVGPPQPMFDSRTVQLLSKDQDSRNAATVQSGQPSASGQLIISPFGSNFAGSFVRILNNQDVGNRTNVQFIRQLNTVKKTVKDQPTPASKKIAKDKPIVVSGRQLKTTVNSSVLTRPVSTILKKTVPDPLRANANMTSIRPGLRPSISNPLIRINSNLRTPVINLPVKIPELPTQPTNDLHDSNVTENEVSPCDSISEVWLPETPDFALSTYASSSMSNNSGGPSSLESDLENVQEKTASGESAKSKVSPAETRTISKGGERNTDKTASEETDPLRITDGDHRYFKSVNVEKKSTANDKDTEEVEKRANVPEREKDNNGCFVCNKMIQNRTLLFAHERSHFKAVECLSYKCRLCSESYRTFEEMVSHRDKHRKEGLSKRKLSDGSSPLDGPGTSKSAKKVKTTSKKSKVKPKAKPKVKPKIKKVIKKRIPETKCVICDLTFKNEKELNKHKESSHTEEERAKPYKCSICEKRFEKKGALQTHVKIHTTTPEPCPQCGKVLKDAEQLKKHIRYKHDSPNPWKWHQCELCPRKYFCKTKLTMHMNLHNGVKPYTCDQCGKGFHNPNTLQQHKVSHSDARPYICHVCGKTFKWNKHLYSHMAVHRGTDSRPKSKPLLPVLCDVCGKKIIGAGALKAHKYRLHKDVFFEQNPHLQRLPCPSCRRVFSSQVSLDRHVENCHANGSMEFECPDCGRKCPSKHRLIIHQRKHTGERPYACSQCDKRFQSLPNLHQHQDTHSDVRQFQCEYCDKTFKRKMHLTTHIRTHTGEKPFVCDICNRGFAQSNDMHKHKRTTHLNEKKVFQCSFCESTFKRKRELDKHILKHSESEQQVEETEEIDYSAILPVEKDADVADEAC